MGCESNSIFFFYSDSVNPKQNMNNDSIFFFYLESYFTGRWRIKSIQFFLFIQRVLIWNKIWIMNQFFIFIYKVILKEVTNKNNSIFFIYSENTSIWINKKNWIVFSALFLQQIHHVTCNWIRPEYWRHPRDRSSYWENKVLYVERWLQEKVEADDSGHFRWLVSWRIPWTTGIAVPIYGQQLPLPFP